MMNCKKVNILLSMLLDGETSAKEEAAVNTHLESCTQCRLEKERLESIHGFLAPPDPIEPLADFISRVKEKAFSDSPQRVPNLNKSNPAPTLAAFLDRLTERFQLKPVLTALACLLLFALSFFLGEMLGEKATTNRQPQQAALNKILPVSVFADIPEGSLASTYYLAQKEN
ncbi:MAG: zf-HC2 domain-containing protein [bacterium]|nr:zf-HC2 domain-containing protein [bacterium]